MFLSSFVIYLLLYLAYEIGTNFLSAAIKQGAGQH